MFLLGCFMAPYFAAQRVILPELVGEDETTIAQANSVIEGGTAFAGLAGPALAGILIPLLGAPNVLYVDAATYAVAFLLVAGFVPRTVKLAAGRCPDGVLAGIKFLLRDKLLGPLSGSVIVLNFLGAGLSAALPFYAYDSFSGDPKIAGLFFTAMGAGALLGSVGAVLVIKRFPPIRLAGLAIVAMSLPLWLLPLDLPAWGVMAALFTATLFMPLVNGPVIGVITARTPAELRPKMMTALISVEHALRAARLHRRGPAARPVGCDERLRGRRGRDDGDGARLRRDRAPASRRAGRRAPAIAA